MQLRVALTALAAAFAALWLSSSPALAAESACGRASFSYAGLAGNAPVRGVSAVVSAVDLPFVERGHVGAWVGVGGDGLGPNRTSEWIQVGMSAFPGGGMHLYYEVAFPHQAPRYVQLAAHVAAGEHHKIAVVEMEQHPDWWRVWLDERPVSVAFHLPGSHNAWVPVVTAESWNGGKTACNHYDYLFQHVSVAHDGNWNGIVAGEVYRDPGYQLLREPAGYRASASGPAPKPPAPKLPPTPKPDPAPVPKPAPVSKPAPAPAAPTPAPAPTVPAPAPADPQPTSTTPAPDPAAPSTDPAPAPPAAPPPDGPTPQ